MTTVVRKATINDLEAYLPMARTFFETTSFSKVVDFDPKGFGEFYINALQNPNIGVWIAEHDGVAIGIAGALCYPMYFNPAYVAAQEIWWWLEPGARGKGAGQLMYQQIQDWAHERGAKSLIMVALENEKTNQFVRLYARQGFKPMERNFFKEIAKWH